MATPEPEDVRVTAAMRAMAGFFDAAWYRRRYPDIVAGGHDPLRHFIRNGLAEQRDPNPFFDSAWYARHYPDAATAGAHPLLHYLQTGAALLHNPHPGFDAAWYAAEHPGAAANPLLYHVKTGQALGYTTEKSLDIRNYMPSDQPKRAMPPRAIVDVVIPVYRGLEETRTCIESVLADAGKPLGRIIVIDDCSPEPVLPAWLDELAAAGRIHLLRNPVNLGFVASVNRGMAAAGRRDVVLLNSDTRVPAGWLARLTGQAYAAPRIASVSPFSNNATICGYPGNQSSPLAFGLTLAAIDAACQTANAGRFADVPTTVGFCMYIRRKALDEVGLFDAERFGLGYGEENDFCLRATALGWQHRLACDTFVYHKGSVSFGGSALRLMRRAMALIQERFPDYPAAVARHVRADAVAPFRFAATAELLRKSGRPVVLMVAGDPGGGVRRPIADGPDRAHVLLLRATDRGAELSVPALPHHPVLALPAGRLDDMAAVLLSMNVSRVHVHRLQGFDMDIRALIRRLNVPFDLTVHDYDAICPQTYLLALPDGVYCGEPGIAGCNACIANRGARGASDIVTWRADRAWQFRDASQVFCPSQDAMDRLDRYGLAARAVFAPPGEATAAAVRRQAARPGQGKLRIAILGSLTDRAGARTVASVAENADPSAIELHLIGRIEATVSRRALRRMTIAGHYDDAALPASIETIAPHLIWFPAGWPDPSGGTLDAAIESGCPIAATDIGAHTERLGGRPLTWLAGFATSPAAWIALFGDIRTALTAESARRKAARGPAITKIRATGGFVASRAAQVAARPSIAIVPERFDNGAPTPCAFIRLLQPLHHPAIAGGFDVRVETAATILHRRADIIITQRFAMPGVPAADRLAEHARAIGATLVFDLDDDLLHLPRTHPDAADLRPKAGIARRMLGAADRVWLSTPGLAERLASLRPDALVMPNGLDERIWALPPMPLRDEPVRILCMGTTTHDRDFALASRALSRLKDDYGDRVEIDVIGMTSRPLAASIGRIDVPQSASLSYPGFVNWLRSRQPRWHIGLAPLLDTSFNRCKSAVKAMDYAALGLAVLASDTPVYRGSVADGPAGRLVANTDAAWYAALDRLIRDRDTRHDIAGRAREAFLASASLASQATVRRDALLRLCGVRSSDAA